MGMWMSLRAYLHDRGLVKDLGFLVGTPKLSSQCERPWSQRSESNPMHFPPESLSACQGWGERVVRTDELVRGPGRGSAGRTGLPGREAADVGTQGALLLTSKWGQANQSRPAWWHPHSSSCQQGWPFSSPMMGNGESGSVLSSGIHARAGPFQGCKLLPAASWAYLGLL